GHGHRPGISPPPYYWYIQHTHRDNTKYTIKTKG
ncbi:unnamed protein product, partial [marine sediment metagenome]